MSSRSSAKRLLIISHYFPPLNRIASLRPASWAKFWPRAGHEVAVLTTQKDPSDGLLDLEIGPEAERGVKIIEVPYPSLRPSLKSSGQGLRGREGGPGLVKRLLKKVLRMTGIEPYSPHGWIAPGIRAATALYRTWPFDAVVSTFGPPASHLIAGSLRRRLPVFWLADYRDLWYGSSLLTGVWPFSWFEDRIERRCVGRADLITTVSDPWREMLAARFRQDVLTIENGFDTEDVLALDHAPAFPVDGRIRIVYTGSIYPERQDIQPLFRALRDLQSEGIPISKKIDVVLFGVRQATIQGLVQRYDLESIVRMPGYLDRKTVLRAQRDADLLVFLDWIDPSFPGMLTGKLYEYLYSGTPVLCIGLGPDTEAARFITDAGIGVCVGRSGESIAALLRNLLSGFSIPYHPSPQILAAHTRERLAARMLDEILRRLDG